MSEKKTSPEMEQYKKDYQQTEDKDVKEKHRVTKTIIAIVLFIVIFFLILLIWYVKDHSVKEIKYDVDGSQAAPAAAQAEAENGDKIVVDGSLLDLTGPTVDITIPLEFYQGKEPADKLTNEERRSGYVGVKKANGNVVYTVQTAYYPSLVRSLYEYYEEYFNTTYEKKNGVQLVSFNREAQTFTITVDKLGFNANKHRAMLKDLYYQVAVYQCYYGFAPKDIKVSFQFKYLKEQFPFVTYQFPAEMDKELVTPPQSDSYPRITRKFRG